MLENTGQTEVKVPNSLAIVAAEAVVERAKEYQEQVREVVERQRADERNRTREHSDASREDAVQVSVGESNDDAPTSSDSGASAQPQQPSRGTAVDLNA